MNLVHHLCADGVQHEPHVHSTPRGGFERIDELSRDLTGVEDIGFEADSILRAADGCEHGRKGRLAVRVDDDRIALGEGMPEKAR